MGDAAFGCFQVSTVCVVHADCERPWIIENVQRKSHRFLVLAQKEGRAARPPRSISWRPPARPVYCCVSVVLLCGGGLSCPAARASRAVAQWYMVRRSGRSPGARPMWDVCRPSFPRCYTISTFVVFKQLPAQLKLLTETVQARTARTIPHDTWSGESEWCPSHDR